MMISRMWRGSAAVRLGRQCQGATAVEYGLIAGLIALGIVAALTATRSSLRQDYACISSAVDTGASTCGAAPAPTTALGGSYDPSLSPIYRFGATVVAANVWQITSYGGSPTVTAPGTVSYAMITPKGWIIVDTQAAP
jgi:pilus assembly protein Flp/PilA